MLQLSTSNVSYTLSSYVHGSLLTSYHII
jgi:hypothetical protein